MVEMWVHMDCSGCENKIRKALSKLKGVHDVEIDMAMQKVTVIGWADQKKVLDAVRKTGCTAVLCPYPLNPETNAQAQQEYHHLQHPTPAHRFLFNSTPRSYNYYKHGYNDSSFHGYYQEPAPTHIIGDDARARFSDDNPNACSVM
ncbi:hypothetical protein BHE74_00026168 [Ensete ventricosum]|nr:hypothetical protein GW17_00003435 [Ensete ventricosum]RWW66453.1 hypothetical protein BHE74_00026168 [Ensete ventricosum]